MKGPFFALCSSIFASSCCITQLVASHMGMSCLGIVKVLSPFQTYFTTLLIVYWAYRLWTCDKCSRRELLLPCVITILVIATPLYVDWKLSKMNTLELSGEFHEVFVPLKDVGCNVCALNAKNALESLDGVLSCSIDIPTQSAKCMAKQGLNSDAIQHALLNM